MEVNMKVKMKPILFTSEMAKKIRGFYKNQTRRTNGLEEINKDNPDSWNLIKAVTAGNLLVRFNHSMNKIEKEFSSKYSIGDYLWVKEPWRFSAIFKYEYKSSLMYKQPEDKWNPSLHMHFDASTIFLKIINIRIERLKDISVEDCLNEGVDNFIDEDGIHYFYVYPLKEKGCSRSIMGHPVGLCNSYISKGILGIKNPEKFAFQSLWQSINGFKSWYKNPWVWVYEFEKINTEHGKCFICGCTDSDCSQCIEKTGKPCDWANAANTVCTACKPNLKKK
ncbi:hypothetical protein GCM10022216_14320 [Sphingobacterium kyonggiense]|uniref:4Fe-4S ferredoxin-type domain-containing protein n=1 Tax=Sphingobacterium kyonggiense TaxID=714075 RepID=A0ABP7YLB6_9SPHI